MTSKVQTKAASLVTVKVRKNGAGKISKGYREEFGGASRDAKFEKDETFETSPEAALILESRHFVDIVD